jgi:4-hydroxy-2-oxoheptanedioate aldolase
MPVRETRAQQTQGAASATLYNAAKQKLKEGKQLVGGTVTSPDPNIYYAMATAGFDFLWIEMQHSALSYQDAARLIWAGRRTPATPILRVPDATEGDIQKATDIGALGIAVPTVDTVEKAEAAVKWARYPPEGRRSRGLGQFNALYGNNYRETANANMLVIIMIETPTGVENMEKIVAVPGIDLIYVASYDLESFSGHREGTSQFEKLVSRIRDVTRAHHLFLGGPPNWRNSRADQGYCFYVGPSETQLITLGAQLSLGAVTTRSGQSGAGVGITEPRDG